MIATRKRGTHYHVDYVCGPVRLRGPLGTSDPKSAKRLATRISFAMSDGPRSQAWMDLEPSLPPQTWKRFSGHAGVSMRGLYTWGGLLSIFWTEHSKTWAKSTARGYDRILKTFEEFLPNAASTPLPVITKVLVEQYHVSRVKSSSKTPQHRNGSSVEKEMGFLHQVFAFAKEEGMVESNPVKKVKVESVRSVTQPYSDEELSKLERTVDNISLYQVVRWTALRGSDIADLHWADVHFMYMEIRRRMIKTGKEVIVPMVPEVSISLRNRYAIDRCPPDTVKVFPEIKDRAALYAVTQAWGNAAKVENCRPHRFRDTIAVRLLLKGGTMYDVAKMLGITTAVAEKHYTPFVPELRSRLRGLLES